METRNTIQRALVLEAVRRFAGHGTAEELYQAVAQRYPHISKGTVYRNLQRLCELGEIRRVEVPDGADRYDRILEDHYHVRCDGCGGGGGGQTWVSADGAHASVPRPVSGVPAEAGALESDLLPAG